MRLILFFAFIMLSVANLFSQNRSTEHKTIIENGSVRSWTIEKEFDQQGNLIHVDSSYSEKPVGDAGLEFGWNSGEMPFGFNQTDMPSMNEMLDSLGFQNFNSLDFEELLKGYHKQMEQLQEFNPPDSLKKDEQFVFPEDKKSVKKI